MSETYKISDVLADETHEAHTVAKSFMEKLDKGEINMCGCMGPMYGEPYCYCQMKQKGLQAEMEGNPLRIAEEERSAAQWKALWEPGGWFYENAKEQG